MEYKTHFATREAINDLDALPKRNSHVQDHIMKYKNEIIILRCDQYFKTLTEVQGQNRITSQEDDFAHLTSQTNGNGYIMKFLPYPTFHRALTFKNNHTTDLFLSRLTDFCTS